jgi:lipopolysaccharide/colanic/teichoic acid biosynthesis glycosyltransferase
MTSWGQSLRRFENDGFAVAVGVDQHNDYTQSGLPLKLRGGKPVWESAAPSLSWLLLKRSLDVVITLPALVLLSPILVIIAMMVASTSRGEILFRQTRLGLHGSEFEIYKFRTMYQNLQDKSGVTQTIAGDLRVTRVGRWLRRTSLDELPQLINILLGHMSLVGPRPHVPGMFAGGVPYDELVPYYYDRLRVRPGLTGWAQVNGLRGPTVDAVSAIARVNHDIAYIQNPGLLLELRILWRTAIVELWRLSGH